MSYHKLDISLLRLPTYWRCTAMTIQQQAPALSAWRRVLAWFAA
jgi:hypothetical protein